MGVPIIRTTVYWGLYWGSPILGKHHLLHNCVGCSVKWLGECTSCSSSCSRLMVDSRFFESKVAGLGFSVYGVRVGLELDFLGLIEFCLFQRDP